MRWSARAGVIPVHAHKVVGCRMYSTFRELRACTPQSAKLSGAFSGADTIIHSRHYSSGGAPATYESL